MKKVDIKFLMLELVIVLGIGFAISLAINAYFILRDGSDGALILFPVLGIVFSLFASVWWFLGGHLKLTQKIVDKTMNGADMGRDVKFFNAESSIFAIDMENGRLLYVSNHNPYQLQILSAAEITDIETWWSKAPMNCTAQVAFQFQYQGKRQRINTYIYRSNRGVGMPINSPEVQDGIAKADLYCEYLNQAKQVALGQQVMP
ncbi:MAG: hypothetical protein J1E01_07695 [Acetatifactor sp.]|nr:hypothetical protein [Acetatifactor sp.]